MEIGGIILLSVIFAALMISILLIVIQKINSQKRLNKKDELEFNKESLDTRENESNQKCKYNEFSKEEFDEIDEIDGEFTYIKDLPHGTLFQVINKGWITNSGDYFTYFKDLPKNAQFRIKECGWFGVVLHKDNETFVKTSDNEFLCNNFPIDEKYYLWVKIVRPQKKK